VSVPESNLLDPGRLLEEREARQAAEGQAWQRRRWEEAQREEERKGRLAESKISQMDCDSVSVQFIIAIGYKSCGGNDAWGGGDRHLNYIKVGLGPGLGISETKSHEGTTSPLTDAGGWSIFVESSAEVGPVGIEASTSRNWNGGGESSGVGYGLGLGAAPLNLGFEYGWG